jgi:uncharacterized protein (TIGR00290 family)
MGGLALSWSGGKDAAWALHELRRRGQDVATLVTTITRDFDRVAIHGVRRSLVRRQAAHLGLPLVEVELPWPCSNELYEFAWGSALAELREREGIRAVAFGDLFLADVRTWRERVLAALGLGAEFPLWGMRTDLLSEAMLAAGVEARIACLDPARVDRMWAGAPWDRAFLAAQPRGVDPCGERGEFHTLVTNGPMFAQALPVETGGTVEREGMVYSDLTAPTGLAPEGSLASPCRDICRLGDDGACDGCGRSLPEIAGWVTMPDDRRRAVLARVRDWQPRGGAGRRGR